LYPLREIYTLFDVTLYKHQYRRRRLWRYEKWDDILSLNNSKFGEYVNTQISCIYEIFLWISTIFGIEKYFEKHIVNISVRNIQPCSVKKYMAWPIPYATSKLIHTYNLPLLFNLRKFKLERNYNVFNFKIHAVQILRRKHYNYAKYPFGHFVKKPQISCIYEIFLWNSTIFGIEKYFEKHIVNISKKYSTLFSKKIYGMEYKKTTLEILVSQAKTAQSANYLYAWDYDITLASHSRWPPSRWGLRCRRSNLSENFVVE
jgi:hypothetical protein